MSINYQTMRVVGGYDDKQHLQRLNLSQKIGSGKFCGVYKCKELVSDFVSPQTEVAVKVYKTDKGNIDYYLNEIKMLALLGSYDNPNPVPNPTSNTKKGGKKQKGGGGKAPLMIDTKGHPNLVKWYSTWVFIELASVGDIKIPLVYPCISYKLYTNTLSHQLNKQIKSEEYGFPIGIVKKIMKDITTGLDYIHSKSIIHIDLKPENIFVDIVGGEPVYVIGDFGSAVTEGEDNRESGTLYYLSPEAVLETPLTTATDIWSLMVIFFRLIFGCYLFDVDDFDKLQYNAPNEVSDNNADDEASHGVSSSNATDSDSTDSSSHSSDSSSQSSSHETQSDTDEDLYTLINYHEKIFGEYTIGVYAGSPWFEVADRLPPPTEAIGLAMFIDLNFDDLKEDYQKRLVDFMLMGLNYDPKQRLSASKLLPLIETL